jgi:hypothetical protein
VGGTLLGKLCDFLNNIAFKRSGTVAESQTQLVAMGNPHGKPLGCVGEAEDGEASGELSFGPLGMETST